jgi:hypothetical protein
VTPIRPATTNAAAHENIKNIYNVFSFKLFNLPDIIPIVIIIKRKKLIY